MLYKLQQINIDNTGKKISAIIDVNHNTAEYSIADVISFMQQGNKIKNALIKDNDLIFEPSNTRFEDLTDYQINEWQFIEYLGNATWKCRCSCGKYKALKKSTVLNGSSKSCGHGQNEFIDLRIQKYFNEWEVLDYIKEKSPYCWKCRCSCGKIAYLTSKDLRTGQTKSCGHNKNQFIDLTGQTFHDWKVLGYAGNGYWTCECTCKVVQNVQGQHLRTGVSKSCGHATSKLKDLTGQQIGNWTVKERVEGYRKPHYRCKCTCGRESIVDGQMLRLRQSLSCGNCSRTDAQVNAVKSPEYFNSTLTRACLTMKRQLTVQEASELFGIGEEHCKRLIRKYNSSAYIIDLTTNRSEAEEDIAKYLESLGLAVIRTDRTILAPQEIDIYVPSYKFALEYNGVYYHNSNKKEEDYHKKKTLRCLEQDIQLMHIFDFEWNNEHLQELLKSLIKTKLGLNETIYARSTDLKEVDATTALQFLQTYHLQGSVHSSVYLGLFYNNELVELMTFGNPRFDKHYQVELLRLCTKTGYTVIGGAQKLFKYYVNTYNPKTIVSYCDISKFSGKVYEQLGMQFVTYTKPGYVYVSLRDFQVLNRLSCTKEKLIAKGWGASDQTEEEIMNQHYFVKVYNCGNAKYSYTRKED